MLDRPRGSGENLPRDVVWLWLIFLLFARSLIFTKHGSLTLSKCLWTVSKGKELLHAVVNIPYSGSETE